METKKLSGMRTEYARDMLYASTRYAGRPEFSTEEAIAKERIVGKYKDAAIVALQDANYREALSEREEVSAFIKELDITDKDLDRISCTTAALEFLRKADKRR